MSQRPNLVLFMMDDLALGDLACHGNPVVRTPRLDALYEESTRLTRYCSGPVCTPARASLMTGRHHQRTKAIDTFCGRAMIDPSERTLAHLLSEAGYRTGCFGKWHLGDTYPMRPQDLGFDRTLVHRSGGLGSVGDHRENACREGEAYFDPVLINDGEPERLAGYCTDIFTESALAFLTDSAERSEPFFLYLATNAPHTPLEVPDRWIRPYRDQGVNETHARLYAMVENIDWNVGRVLDRLAHLARRADTVVLFTSDHGPCPSARDFSAPPGRQQRWNAGLRGEKGSLYQGAIRVPSFWSWPGVIASGRDVANVTSVMDVLPTVAAAAGATLPSDRVVDGIDLLPLLKGDVDPEDWPSRTVVMQWHRGDVPVRDRNYAVIGDRFKLYRPESDADDELYDLDADPGEAHDVAALHPSIVDGLRTRYVEWFEEVGGDDPSRFAPPRIRVGAVAERSTTLSRQDWRVDPSLADLGEIALWRTADLEAEWLIEVERAGAYKVDVRLEPFSWKEPKLFTSVHLSIDGVARAVPWAPMCTLFELPDVFLETGPAAVRAWSEGPSGLRQAALYVDIAPTTRQPQG
jgi:arylsulfatase A-like enzyme